MSVLELRGCPFQPLGSYLKALGILRLVHEQADSSARGWWGSACFVLESKLDEAKLCEFFLKRYEPTPILAPWNGGSGFYPKDRKVGIDAILASAEDRFASYREAIGIARAILELAGAAKGASKADEDNRRETVLRLCRNRLPDACVEWLDAAIAISAEGKRAFAPILGTGGNEGRLDYTNNFMENLAGLLIAPDRKTPVSELLSNALFDSPTAALRDIAVGQYDPGRAGGFNQGTGVESGAVANPWSAVLTLEGAVAWAGGIHRKQGMSFRSFLCSPFTVYPSAVGYGSKAKKDEATARAEVWTPIWPRAARYPEVRNLLREGRAAVGAKPAQTGLEFAQAAASLGVDRGISQFVRYGLLKRRGDSYVALPAGKFPVEFKRDSDLIRELGPLLERAEWAAKGTQKEPPNSWEPVRRAVEEGMFQVLLRGNQDPALVCDTAAAVGAVHRWLLERGRSLRLDDMLNAEWVKRCARGGRVEVRIAAALASLTRTIRRNIVPDDAHYSWSGRDLSERMLNTVRRRTLSGAGFESWNCAWPEDITRFIDGAVDDQLIEDLVYAFVLVNKPELPRSSSRHTPWPVYCLLKQMFLPGPFAGPEGEIQIRPDLAVPSLLVAGRVREAADLASRRLRIAGLAPVKAEYDGGVDARRLGAALLIPAGNLTGIRASILEAEAD